ncbi:hypothetical protein BGZ83_002863 [Gryganskiella cystojenkinii]|nr:hypothetical protein BGZ83_002863 [Gryganskiella cystojenkinii]
MSTPQEIFKALAAIPSYSDAVILPNSTDTTLNIQVSLSQRDLERDVRRKFTRTVVATVGHKSIPLVIDGPSVDTGNVVAQIVSPSGQHTAILRTIPGEKKKQFVEIWSEGSISQLLDTTALHEDFYADSTFGGLQFSRDEAHLVYVAERKKTEDITEKFNYKPDWGETFTGKRDPALVVVNLEDFEVKVLDAFEGDMSPGQPIFSHDSKSIIFTGYHRNPQFFGIIYCQNRLSGLYQIKLDGSGLKHITEGLKSARSPRLNKDGSILIDMASGQISTVVDIVRTPTAEKGFPGLFIDQLPQELWVSPTKIVTSTAWRSRRTAVAIDIESGDVEELTVASSYPGTTTVLFVNSRWILATYSTPTEPWMLFLGQVEFGKNQTDLKVHFTVLESSKVEKAKGFYQPHSWSIVNKIPGQLESLETILLEPNKSNSTAQQATAVSGARPPLVIFPHGGPHSGFAAEFSALTLVLVSLGFAVACVNFTGSLGFGQDAVETLVGRVGELDVNECQAVRDYVISKGQVDPDRTCLTGGSHGGFIVCHLLADPSYKAAVMRNPVTDIPAMTSITDIADWCYAVNGLEYDMESPPTATLSNVDVFQRMRRSSPMEHIEKVVAPTLMLLGSGDRRVPPAQGVSWWQARQNKIKRDQSKAVNKIQVFDGTGHALDSVEAERHALYSLASFLVEHTRVERAVESAKATGVTSETDASVGRQGEGGRGSYI